MRNVSLFFFHIFLLLVLLLLLSFMPERRSQLQMIRRRVQIRCQEEKRFRVYATFKDTQNFELCKCFIWGNAFENCVQKFIHEFWVYGKSAIQHDVYACSAVLCDLFSIRFSWMREIKRTENGIKRSHFERWTRQRIFRNLLLFCFKIKSIYINIRT